GVDDDHFAVDRTPVAVATVVAVLVAALEALAEVVVVLGAADVVADVAEAGVDPHHRAAVSAAPAVVAVGATGTQAFAVALVDRAAQDVGAVVVHPIPLAAAEVAVVAAVVPARGVVAGVEGAQPALVVGAIAFMGTPRLAEVLAVLAAVLAEVLAMFATILANVLAVLATVLADVAMDHLARHRATLLGAHLPLLLAPLLPVLLALLALFGAALLALVTVVLALLGAILVARGCRRRAGGRADTGRQQRAQCEREHDAVAENAVHGLALHCASPIACFTRTTRHPRLTNSEPGRLRSAAVPDPFMSPTALARGGGATYQG